MRRVGCSGALALVVALVVAGPAGAQGLADFDYENLSFRGIGFEVGRIVPSRVEDATSVGLRLDLGYLGPGVRILPGISYWSSSFKGSEVTELEERVASLVAEQTGEPAPAIDLGVIDWRDVVLSLDAQVVWQVPYGLLTYAGAGISAHMLDGRGAAIDDTFIEDLLDSVTAGFNVHTGLEVPLNRFRPYLTGRYEVTGDVQYFELRVGGQIMFGPAAPGEERR